MKTAIHNEANWMRTFDTVVLKPLETKRPKYYFKNKHLPKLVLLLLVK